MEWDYYNFEALNIPAEHPARDNMSSSWIDAPPGEKGKQLLRTHGTAVSARIVETMKPPIRTIEPARVYRYEAVNATHLNIYHNMDGLAVDKNITMADLKGVLFEFVRRYFGEERKVRFRTDFFPFVEPGGEIAIDCIVLPRHRLPFLRQHRLAGDTGLRHDPPGGAAARRHRPEGIYQLRLRHGAGTPAHAALRHRRYPAFLQ